MEWRSDAKLVVYQINSKEEPKIWKDRNKVKLICHFFQQHENWSLVWVPRTQNKGVNLAAKRAQVENCNVEVVAGFANSLSSSLLNCIALERTQIPLL